MGEEPVEGVDGNPQRLRFALAPALIAPEDAQCTRIFALGARGSD